MGARHCFINGNGQEAHQEPDFGAAVLEELEKFGDHDVQRSVQSVAVQELRGILTDFLKSAKGSLKKKKHKNFKDLQDP